MAESVLQMHTLYDAAISFTTVSIATRMAEIHGDSLEQLHSTGKLRYSVSVTGSRPIPIVLVVSVPF